jgi:hypothetical protein
MPWNEVSIVGQREGFVRLPEKQCSAFAPSARDYPTTAYEWLEG